MRCHLEASPKGHEHRVREQRYRFRSFAQLLGCSNGWGLDYTFIFQSSWCSIVYISDRAWIFAKGSRLHLAMGNRNQPPLFRHHVRPCGLRDVLGCDYTCTRHIHKVGGGQ